MINSCPVGRHGMKTAHHRYAVAILALMVLPVPAWGAVAEEDPIKAELDAAKKAWLDTVNATKATFLKAFDDELKKIAAKGDLNAYKAMQKDKEKALAGTKLAESHPLHNQQSAFFKKNASARKPLAAALDLAVKKYTMNLEIDKAAEVQNHLKIFQTLIGFDEKIAEYDRGIRQKPDFYENYYLRGVIYFEKNEPFNAIPDCTQAIRLKPDHADSYLTRGYSYETLNEYDKAISDYGETIRLRPDDHHAYDLRASLLCVKSEYDKALADGNQAIRLKPSKAEYYETRGSIYFGKKDYTKAISDYTKTIKLKPDYADAYLLRGIAYRFSDNYAAASRDYTLFIRSNPVSISKLARAYFLRADALRKLGSITKYKADLEKAKELRSRAKQ